MLFNRKMTCSNRARISGAMSVVCQVVFASILIVVPNLVLATVSADKPGGVVPLLHWEDRRPIGRIFLSRVRSGWETNPRGFLNSAKIDITTSAGISNFRTKLLEKANKAVENLQAMNAQGVVVWDIEGQEMPHAISYIGDPRVLPEIAPEMDALADEFFAVFTKAGLRTGITIRPTKVVRRTNKEDKWPWKHVKVEDPVSEMADKIRYAKKRWGISIYYLDSNVSTQVLGNSPWVLPVGMIRRLKKLFPDVLFIPEWETPEYYEYSVPYKDWWDGYRTPDDVKQNNPEAFSIFVPKPQNVSDHYHAVRTALENGDTTWVDAFNSKSISNQIVSMLYTEIELRGLIASNEGHYPEYLRSLDLIDKGSSANFQELEKLLLSDNLLVQRNGIEALGEIQNGRSIELLVGVLFSRKRVLIPFATTALGSQGEFGALELMEMLKENELSSANKRRLITAIGKTKAGIATFPLIGLLDSDPENKYWRKILLALKEIKDPKSVPRMLQLLEQNNRKISKLAFENLQVIGNSQAIAGLMKYINSDDKFLRRRSRAVLKNIGYDYLQ